MSKAHFRYHDVAGRLRRRAEPDPRAAAGRGRRADPRVDRRARELAASATGWTAARPTPTPRSSRNRSPTPARSLMGRRMFSGGAGPVGRRPERGRLVGRRPSLPRAGVRPHPPRPRDRDEARRGPRSRSSPTASRRRSSRLARPPATRTSRSPAARDVVQQYLAAGLIDEFQVHVAPLLLGDGVRLFDQLGTKPELEVTRVIGSSGVTHLKYRVVK